MAKEKVTSVNIIVKTIFACQSNCSSSIQNTPNATVTINTIGSKPFQA